MTLSQICQVNGEPFDAGQYSFFGDLGDDGGLEDELGGLEVRQFSKLVLLEYITYVHESQDVHRISVTG